MLFVVEGFEHCVANMYYITAGLIASHQNTFVNIAIEQYGLTLEKIQALNLKTYFVNNLIPVTIGNIIGGALCLGLPLVYLNISKSNKNENKNPVKEVA